ncbi:MAG: polysaccharide deacetylase family protein [Candidatus Sulfotelmatobacter sp.]
MKHAVYPALHRIGWLNRIPPLSDCTVVNYHGVVPADYCRKEAFLDGNLARPEMLRQQLQFLKAHYCIIPPDEFRAWIEQGKPLPPRAALLTCDDGLLNHLTDLLPVLQSERASCLFFVTAASCRDNPGILWYEELYHLMRSAPLTGSDLELPPEEGTAGSTGTFQAQWWNTVRRASRLDAAARADWMGQVRRHCGAQLPRFERRWRLLNVSELRQLAEAGMSIGAHTCSHPVLSLSNDAEARREIQQSKSEIEGALGRPVWAFAYPFGNPSTMGEREVRLACEAGFCCAFLNVEQGGTERSKPFTLSRIHVTGDMHLPEFAAHLSGLHTRLQRAVFLSEH